MNFKIHSLPKSLRSAGWEQLLSEWSRMINSSVDLSEHASRDVVYWYGERALTGLLAAAAWRIDGWSLEEWTARRGRGKAEGAARGDLWLATENGQFTVETKVSWPCSTWAVAHKYARTRIKEARHQLRSMDRDYRFGKPIALCYIVPAIAVKGAYNKDDLINEFFTKIPKQRKDFNISASYRPKGPCPEFDNRKYPGVILVGHLLDNALNWN